MWSSWRCRWRRSDIETEPLFDDPFLLAVPASDPRPDGLPVSAAGIDRERLILLEEGHCLRDQALAYCSGAGGDVRLGATSLATVMQMVANGYGITLLPRIAVGVEVRDSRVRLLPFEDRRDPAARSASPGGAPRRASRTSRRSAS